MSGKVIAITGGFGILGEAASQAALEAGWTVVAIDRADAPRESFPDGAHAMGGVDLTQAEAAADLFNAIVKKHGRLDALLNIAGGFRWETLEDGSIDSWDFLYTINVKTAATACKMALPYLKAAPAGRIVNVGAAAALKAGMGMGAYTASKSGVMRLTEALAEELKSTNVTVNAVLPSIIDTPQNRADMPDTDPDIWVKPADLAAVMLFLASDDARAVTGALVPVTGKV
ncbi:SDR family NAD(P)-dependent oxidoreductase [Hyphobacterium sp. HN65]|uniref:SDR family NAD(P)-dependent oxidoreductase n=1 Tax=Hyphobacterium lacteum TaxID=3116575 RepID=A0ABU7LNX3_9PROT|nr:SDR family NAD(P)-dependent oxidoreductase [Hyphobacterium sp. HN65]MEE2525583.1 SDR family NAD(P)-dependent oxidoreductase [Hyphobacterium sp. HN65]